MAKKGGVQQLQVEVNNDDDFNKFLDKDGILLLDVYTEWCGPCLGIVGNLKKIKLEIGGDNLQLAVCKSDDISYLERFRNKSEPTWLFAAHKKVINCMFGTDVPMLTQLIQYELDLEEKYKAGEATRVFYEWDELTPVEQKRADEKQAIEDERIQVEAEAAENKRHKYIQFVCDEITTRMVDVGVIIAMPHITDVLLKDIIDVGEANFELSLKEKKQITITPYDIEILKYDCDNLLSDEIIEYLYDKEVTACAFRLAETDLRKPEDVMNMFIQDLNTPTPILDEFGKPNADGLCLPRKVNFFTVYAPLEKSESVAKESEISFQQSSGSAKDSFGGGDVTDHGDDDEHYDMVEGEQVAEEVEPEEQESVEELHGEPLFDMPGVWCPENIRGHAILIYLFFRALTDHFLPPDPVPDPPHVCMIFDSFKRRDVYEIWEEHSANILAYGFFTTQDPATTQLIAKTPDRYNKKKPQMQDKLIMKVAKVTSHTLLALAAIGPSYVSQNTVKGEEECLQFFPEGFKNGESEEEAEAEVEVQKKGKKKRKKKSDTSLASGEQTSEGSLVSGSSGSANGNGSVEGGEAGSAGEAGEPLEAIAE